MSLIIQFYLMINSKLLLGRPLKYSNICTVYPPSINEILDTDTYPVYQKILTISNEELFDAENQQLEEEAPRFTISMESNNFSAPQPISFKKQIRELPTPLEYILINCYNDKSFLELTIAAFKFFTHAEILPLYDQKAIYVGNLTDLKQYKSISELPLLTNDNFFDFQNLIRIVMGMDQVDKPDPNEDPRITRMKAKARLRDKIKAKSGEAIDFDSVLVAICCMGIGITPLNIGELSYSAVMQLLKVYQTKERYELDTSSLLAGADPKKIKPKYWITKLN